MNAHTATSVPAFGSVVAVAAAISAAPSEWIGNAILHGYRTSEAPAQGQFWRRLELERARIEPDLVLGFGVLKILGLHNLTIVPEFESFLRKKHVRESIRMALTKYSVQPGGPGGGLGKLALRIDDQTRARRTGAVTPILLAKSTVDLVGGHLEGDRLIL